MERHNLLTHWKNINSAEIDTPFILVHSHNENYGLLSTLLPNRTANWGICCSQEEYATLMDILNHNKTLLFLTNQHNNITHPKLLTMPRGESELSFIVCAASHRILLTVRLSSSLSPLLQACQSITK